MESRDFKILKFSEIQELRNSLLKENNICPLCKREIKNPVLDHQHMTNSEKCGQNGAGLVRGILCSNCNIALGKIENIQKRYSIPDLFGFLLNTIEYLKKDNLPFLYPSEAKRLKDPKMMKSEYNKLIKEYCIHKNISKEKAFKKFPYNPKILTKSLKDLRDFILSINTQTKK